MDNDKNHLMKVAVGLQKKYNKMNEIYDLTKQMQECLYREDMYSLGLIVKMRTEAIIEIDNIENNNKELIDGLAEDEKNVILNSMKVDSKPEDISLPALKKINEIYSNLHSVWERTMELDSVVNSRANKGKSNHVY